MIVLIVVVVVVVVVELGALGANSVLVVSDPLVPFVVPL